MGETDRWAGGAPSELKPQKTENAQTQGKRKQREAEDKCPAGPQVPADAQSPAVILCSSECQGAEKAKNLAKNDRPLDEKLLIPRVFFLFPGRNVGTSVILYQIDSFYLNPPIVSNYLLFYSVRWA